MQLTIMENASDSLRRALTYYSEQTTSGLKAAVKELISCIELFIKEKIRQLDLDSTDPVLLFTSLKITVDRSQGLYRITPLSRKRTVTFEEAIQRLEWLGEPISKADQKVIKRLKAIRNELEHLAIDQDPNAVLGLFAPTLGFTVRFVEKYLSTSLHALVEPDTWKSVIAEQAIHQEVEKSFRELRNSVLAAEASLTGTATCIHCGTDLVVATRGYYSGIRCSVCGHTQEFEMCYGCKEDFPLDELKPAEGDTHLCVKCSEEVYESSKNRMESDN